MEARRKGKDLNLNLMHPVSVFLKFLLNEISFVLLVDFAVKTPIIFCGLTNIVNI